MDDCDKKAPELSYNRVLELSHFVEESNIPISNLNLLDTALTHSSYANESINKKDDNERLEFLGDSVLQLSISSYLYNNLDMNEGFYTRLRSAIVSEDALYNLSNKLNISKYILIGKGEEHTGGRGKKALLADAMEAVLGAIYLDNGFNTVSKFIIEVHKDYILSVLNNNIIKDYKTTLQEYVQTKWKITPTYILHKTEGPEHDKVFYYSVKFKNKSFGPSFGKNKKDAEQNVAKLALTNLGLIPTH